MVRSEGEYVFAAVGLCKVVLSKNAILSAIYLVDSKVNAKFSSFEGM
jgi:hypothetical protein